MVGKVVSIDSISFLFCKLSTNQLNFLSIPSYLIHSMRYNNNNRYNKRRSNSNRPPFRRPQHNPSQKRDEAEVSFLSKVSIDPAPWLELEKGSSEPTTRAIDILCPIGKGQRGLIVSPPKSGKTTFLKHICQALTKSQPDLKVYCLLIDERPEEVTDFRRNVDAEVRWSSSDQSYENHIKVAEDLMKQAVQEADSGKDVMILLDSLTRLARVHNSQVRGRGRTMSGGVDSEGLRIPRRIFGMARNIEGGGSLGILATILVDTGSRMDEVIFQEFKGTGNMELVLSREASDRRIFPAIDVRKTGTRKEEKLLPDENLKKIYLMRSALANMSDLDASQTLVDLLANNKTNLQALHSF